MFIKLYSQINFLNNIIYMYTTNVHADVCACSYDMYRYTCTCMYYYIFKIVVLLVKLMPTCMSKCFSVLCLYTCIIVIMLPFLRSDLLYLKVMI